MKFHLIQEIRAHCFPYYVFEVIAKDKDEAIQLYKDFDCEGPVGFEAKEIE